MATELIIDGYNLLHHAGLQTRSAARSGRRTGEFEQARDRLLKRLKESLTEKERSATTIVFDAQHADHVDRRPTVQFGMTVLFSAKGRQADDLIEDILCAHKQPRQLRVVSSDQRLRQAARAVGADSIDSDSFLVELDTRKERNRVSLDEIPAIPDEAVTALTAEDWLKEFGDIDPLQIEQELTGKKSHRRVPPVAAESPQEKKFVKKPEPPPATSKQTPPVSKPKSPDPTPRPATTSSTETPEIPESELAFWEARIADLLKDPHR